MADPLADEKAGAKVDLLVGSTAVWKAGLLVAELVDQMGPW